MPMYVTNQIRDKGYRRVLLLLLLQQLLLQAGSKLPLATWQLAMGFGHVIAVALALALPFTIQSERKTGNASCCASMLQLQVQ